MSPEGKQSNSRPRQASFKDGLKGNHKHLYKSLVLHVCLVILLAMSWSFSDPVKHVELPKSMQARVLSAAELEQLRAQKQNEQRAIDNKKKQAEKKKQEALAKKRKQEQAKKKQAEAKKREAEKKALIAKKKEQEKKRAEQKKAEEARKRAEQEAEKKRLARERLEAEEREREAQARKKVEEERERKLAEKLAAVSQTTGSAGGFSDADISERDKFVALIRDRIEQRWHIPPKSRGRQVELRISLLPSGDRAQVEVLNGSGNRAFDQSALNAVRAVRVFPVPKDSELFEAYFRRFTMKFSPPDDG